MSAKPRVETGIAGLDKMLSGGFVQGSANLVRGAPGSGKSALLANWIARCQRCHPDTYILYHFVGGAPDSASHYALMRRIMEEMKDRFGVEEDIPTEAILGWRYGDLYRMVDGSAHLYVELNTPERVEDLRQQLRRKLIELVNSETLAR